MWQRADQVVAAVGLPHRQIQAPGDGIFLLVVHVTSRDTAQPPRPLNVTVHIEMKADYGYLSAADWPNLPVRPARAPPHPTRPRRLTQLIGTPHPLPPWRP